MIKWDSLKGSKEIALYMQINKHNTLHQQNEGQKPYNHLNREEAFAAILWDTGHTKRRSVHGRDKAREGHQKPECG
jgi:hypothetical protein